MKMLILLQVFAVSLLMSSCQTEVSPEAGLRSYVNYASTGSATKEGFLERSTGDLRASLETMDEEQFKIFSEQMKHSIRKDFDIHKKNCQELRCFITYTLEYEAQSKEQAIYRVDVRKIAELVKEDEQWKIASVENVKSYYEGSSELSPDDMDSENQGVREED